MKPIIKQKTKGFTLIEVVVASTILISALGLAVTIVGNATLQIVGSKNRVTAVYLMQECMELTRNARDTATRHLNRWHCPFFDSVSATTPIYLKISPNTETSGSDCQQNYGASINEITDENGGVTHTLQGTTYTTLLTVEEIITEEKVSLTGAPETVAAQIKTKCEVRWQSQIKQESLSATQVLTNWYTP